jgi:hypothetical protein
MSAVVCLIQDHQDRAARSHIVERRVQVVHAEKADIAKRVANIYCNVAVLLEQRN